MNKLLFLLVDFLGWTNSHPITTEEELQKQEQIASVHDQGSLDVPHISPAALRTNMFQGVESQENTHHHL